MVDLNAFLTPLVSNLISPLPMSGDEVDLFSILEVEFLLEIPTLFGLRF
jgi:hypothetical protein